jgi:hypothetical protein
MRFSSMVRTINEAPFDRFTLAHVVVGYLLKRGGWSAESTLIAAIAWEVVEPMLKENSPDAFPHPEKDSAENKVVDVVATMIGWAI